MSDPTYPLFPIFAGLGFILALIPIPWHLQAWNAGTCFFMLWAALACLNQFINSLVWARTILNLSPAWCEISIRIILGASVGIPASSLCISRRLYHIARIQSIAVTREDKKRAILVDTCICIVFPLLFIALQYVVQGHRYDIFEQIGCYPALYNTLPTFFISYMWSLLLGIISAVYSVLTLREFSARRVQFSQYLSSNKALSVSRYFRLMALAMTNIVFTTPLAIFVIWLNASATSVQPWISWEDTHFDFFRVGQIPALLWRSNHLVVVSMEISRWFTPMCSIIFFAYFGFADEAKRHYRLMFHFVARCIGISSAPLDNGAATGRYQKKTSAKPSLQPDVENHPTAFQLHNLKRSPSLTTVGSETAIAASLSISTKWSEGSPRSNSDLESQKDFP